MLGRYLGESRYKKMMNVVLCSDRPIKINEWQSYTVEGTINANSKSLSFGGLCLYNGKFYFDKIELFIRTIKVLTAVQILILVLRCNLKQ
jgi:hypothetical protein